MSAAEPRDKRACGYEHECAERAVNVRHAALLQPGKRREARRYEHARTGEAQHKQRPPAQLVEVHAHEIGVLVRHWRRDRQLRLVVFRCLLVVAAVEHGLICKRLWLLLLQQLLWRRAYGRQRVVGAERHETELLGAIAPVEHPRIAFRFDPIDEGLVLRPGAAARQSERRNASMASLTAPGWVTGPMCPSSSKRSTVTRGRAERSSRTTACADYFPIIYVKGDLKIQANSIAQGVLLVDGSVEMAGNFTFNGIMVVRNDIKSTGNGNKITGSAFAGNTYTADNTTVSGNSEIQYSSCAVERAGKAAASIVRAKERGFAEIIQ